MERSDLSALILGSYAVKATALLLSLAFVLVAPNFMGAAYTEYVFYTRVVAFLALILTFGSAGTISRFARYMDAQGLGVLIGNAFHAKYRLAIVLLIPLAVYTTLSGSYIFLMLLLLALLKALFDAILLLVYALEHYRERLYFQFLHAIGRVLLLPVSLLSQAGYITVTELIGYIPALRVFSRRFSRHQIFSMFRGRRRESPAQVDSSLLSRVEWHTYASNLLYYLLPIHPVLVFNYQTSHSLRELTISYVLAVNVMYALLSAVNDVILPRLVTYRQDRRRLGMFLFLSLALTGVAGALAYPVFASIETWLAQFYGLEALSSFYPFLLFGLTLIVLNSIRQIMFVRDHSALFSLILVLGYIFLIYELASGKPLIDIITPMSVGLLTLSIALALATLRTE